MRAVLTGYRGLIGHAIHDAFGNKVSVLTAGRGAGADIALDLSNLSNLKLPAFTAQDVFIHAAGITDEELNENPDAAILRATKGFDALLSAITKVGIRRFIYISSAHVLGVLEGELSERSAPNPMSIYALMHYASEQLLKRYAVLGKLDSVTILRPCAVYGMPQQLERFVRWSLIPYSFPKEAVEKHTITLQTAGLQERNFVSIETIASIVQQQAISISGGVKVIHPKGAITESVRAFADRCARIYQAQSVKTCEVVVPKAAPDTALSSPLAFHSDWIIPEPSGALDAYLKDMIHILSKPHA
jgi:UDP-glucose 4-epimerase